MIKYFISITRILLLFFLITLSSCASSFNTSGPIPSDQTTTTLSEQDNIVISEFILGTGDVIDIEVFRTPHSELVLWTGDTVEIKLLRYSEYNYSFKLGPDGLLTLPYVGDVQAAGLTKIELRNKITKGLSRNYVNPQVSVNILPGRELKITELSSSFTIGPTGKIIYPMLGDLQVAGKSIFSLRNEIEAKLAENFTEPKVSVTLSSMESQKYLVLGQVQQPGVYTLTTKTSILSAITQASGPTDDAKLANVLLIRNSGKKSEVVSIDMDAMNATGNKNPHAIFLQKDDIIYVPASRISKISSFMGRIGQILQPFVSLETGIVMWPRVIDTLEGEDTKATVNINSQ